MLHVQILLQGDESALARVADGVFDNAVQPGLAVKYLENPQNHIAVAIEDGIVVGFASGIHSVHPDKQAQMWINEVGVAPTHQRRGIGKAVLTELIALARKLGCSEAWVLTDEDNASARALYRAAGGTEARCLMVSFPFSAPG